MNFDNLISIIIGGVFVSIEFVINMELVLIVFSGVLVNILVVIELVMQEVMVSFIFIFYVGENCIVNIDFEVGSGDDFDEWEKFNGVD